MKSQRLFNINPLQKHMTYAVYGMEQVYLDLPLGGLNRVDIRKQMDPELLSKQFKIFSAYRRALDEFAESYEKSKPDCYNVLDKLSEIKKSLKGGMCGEYAEFAVEKILDKYPHARNLIEFGFVKKSFHQFVVIGRAKNSKPDEPATWGNAAVILDPWAKKIYKASDFAKIRSADNITYVEPIEFNEVLEMPECHYLEGDLFCMTLDVYEKYVPSWSMSIKLNL